VGRIVIETDPQTGMDHVELTLDNGQVMIFHGQGDSELKFVRGEQDWVDVTGGDGVKDLIPGRREPDHWQFSINIDKIPGVIVNHPEEPDGATPQ
jgi:hypothetical protein